MQYKLSQSASSHARPLTILRRKHMKTDCFPGIVSLVRALMKSRTGVRKSDTVVNYLVRATIQTGASPLPGQSHGL